MMKIMIQKLKMLISKLTGHEIHTEEIKTAVTDASGFLIKCATLSNEEILKKYNSSLDGLAEEEAEKRIIKFGLNEVAHEKAPTWHRQLLNAFLDPFIGILLILAIASFFTEYLFAPIDERDYLSVIIISILILVSVILTFVQEYQSSQAAEKLLSFVQNTALVRRTPKGKHEIKTNKLVPGDIIHLSAGDIIPADVRWLSVNNLTINEASLTGESLPVEKISDQLDAQNTNITTANFTGINPLDLDNIGFMSTNVVSGSGIAIILTTGNETYFGSMSEELVGHHPPSNFDIGVNKVSMILIRLMLVMVPVIFLVNGITHGDWFQALLFGLAVAVGLTPEMLPTIVTANLAKGTIEMAQQKTIVKRLSAIQNLGAMDVLCTDKTGTLTEDSVGLEAYINLGSKQDDLVYKYTYLNSFFQSGLRNPLDDAVKEYAEIHHLSNLKKGYQKIDEIPFETERRRMSVIVKSDKNGLELICKGAVKEILSVVDSVITEGKRQELNPQLKGQIIQQAETLTRNGLRVLLVAFKHVEHLRKNFNKDDESGLTLLGMIGFLDPPKETSGEAIKAIENRGIRVVVVTGDNEIATRRICQDIGFNITKLVEGYQVDQISDTKLSQLVEDANVFVRTAPLQKSRIINALKNNDHAVGFLGDGINDAPALRDADVGISVDNAVDIAKESADILLLEKSLMVLEEGVGRGRVVFGNIMKYIKMTVSSNFGNVFSVLVASIVIPFTPMLPLHLLLQNLLYDISQLTIPWDHVDEEFLRKPRKWDPKGISKFTLLIGPVSSIFDFTTFALLWFIIGANSVEQQSLFHSGWFVLGLLSQTLIVHMIRTQKVPFIQSTASWPVNVTTILVMMIGIIIPFTTLGSQIGLQPLPLVYFPWLILTLICYCVVIQLIKTWYVKRFNSWL
jgi:P-type Mg2+ transporter